MAYTEVEVFIPAGGPEDAEREEFLDTAEQLVQDGFPITVYVRGSEDWAFEQCEHVADMVAASGEMVLPITLLGPQIVTSWQYPSEEQMKRFAQAAEPKRKDPRFSAAAAACGPGGMPHPGIAAGAAAGSGTGAASGAPAEKPAPAGFAAVLAGVQEKPRGGPEIGARRNLMGGDFGAGLPAPGESAARTEQNTDQATDQDDDAGSGTSAASDAAQSSGGCCGGACGCGH